MPLLAPVTRSVSASISARISSKSVNFFPLQWRNSPHSARTGMESTELRLVVAALSLHERKIMPV